MKKLLVALLLFLIAVPSYAQIKKHDFNVALETTSYTYREPGVAVRWDGMMTGIALDYIGRSVFTSDNIDTSDKSFVNIQGRYMQGSVDYDGRLNTGTTKHVNNIDDFFVEGALMAGAVYEIPKTNLELWPYIGFGYRYLNDGFDKDPQGYERSSRYIYSPIGFTAKLKGNNGWLFSFNAEYDQFWSGTQTSNIQSFSLTDTGGTVYNFNGGNIKNKQTQGYGARLSAKAQKDLGKMGLFIEPFFRYWHIQSSDLEISNFIDNTGSVFYNMAILEPKNETTEWGLRIGVNF